MSVSKEVSYSLRWYKAILKHKESSGSTQTFTNFSLQNIWDRFDCQTQLLQREATIRLISENPELLDTHRHSLQASYFAISKSSRKIF